MREHEWNPLRAQPGRAAARADRAPVRAGRRSGWTALAGRLAAVPDALATARAVLRDCPRIHAGDRGRAVRRHGRAGPRRGAGAAGGGAGAGRRRWSRSPAAAVAGARRVRRLAAAPQAARRERPRPAAGPAAVGGPALAHPRHRADRRPRCSSGRGTTSTGSTRELRASPPSWSVARPTTRRCARRARPARPPTTPTTPRSSTWPSARWSRRPTFVREHDLVSLVDDPCVIQEMPEFARGVAVAYCDSPGPLETADAADVLLHLADAGGLVRRSGSSRSTASTTTT